MRRTGAWILLGGILILGLVFRFREDLEQWYFQRSLPQDVPTLSLGSPAARVQVTAFVPFGEPCRRDIRELHRLVRKYRGKIRVRFLDFSSQEGKELAAEEGFDCAGIAINGKIMFRGPVASAKTPAETKVGETVSGQESELTPHHPPFKLEALRRAVIQAVEEAYGSAAPKEGEKP